MKPKFDQLNLKNRLALITGAGGLMGRTHILALTSLGCTVIATDLSKKSLLNNYNYIKKNYPNLIQNIILKKMDVTNENSIKSCYQMIKKKFNSLDILINNAAYNPPLKDLNRSSLFESYELTKWNNEIKIGLTGAFLCCKHFAPDMVNSKYNPVILNIASDLSVISPDQRLYSKSIKNKTNAKPVSYSVVKNGLHGLTKYLSTYWIGTNLRCNSFSPGGILNNQSIEFQKKLKKLIPLNRMATKYEYIGVIQFLCSDASSYLNGQNIVVDGGRSVW